MIDFNLRLIIREKQLEIKYTGTVFSQNTRVFPKFKVVHIDSNTLVFWTKSQDLEQSFQNEHFLVHVTRSFFQRWSSRLLWLKRQGCGAPKSLGIRTCSPKVPVAENNFPTKGRRGGGCIGGNSDVLFLSWHMQNKANSKESYGSLWFDKLGLINLTIHGLIFWGSTCDMDRFLLFPGAMFVWISSLSAFKLHTHTPCPSMFWFVHLPCVSFRLLWDLKWSLRTHQVAWSLTSWRPVAFIFCFSYLDGSW